MKKLYKLGRFRREHHLDCMYRVRCALVRRLLDCLRVCPIIFEVDISNLPNPCRNLRAPVNFDPGQYTLAGGNFWSWLLETEMAGKVKVDFWFRGWYSSFLHEDSLGSSEHGTMRIAFSHKESAALFKLKFADPALRLVRGI